MLIKETELHSTDGSLSLPIIVQCLYHRLNDSLYCKCYIGHSKNGQQVRKGKAILLMYTNRMKDTYRMFDLQGTCVPTAQEAEWLICVCLNKTGSSGYLGPGALARAAD